MCGLQRCDWCPHTVDQLGSFSVYGHIAGMGHYRFPWKVTKLNSKVIRYAVNALLYVLHPRLIVQYWRYLRQFPQIAVPGDANEKMLWRKIFDRNPDFVQFSDKLGAKDYVRQKAPDIAQSPVLWTGTDLDHLPGDLAGKRCFLKANHGSGMNIPLDGGPVDRHRLLKVTRGWLAHRHDRVHGEWAYRDVEPKFFLETDISAGQQTDLVDLLVYVFSKTATLIVATIGEKTDHERVALFDAKGRRLKAVRLSRRNGRRPAELSEDFDLPVDAEALGRHALMIAGGIDHVRVDFMWNGEALYFGELTVYPGGGYRVYTDPEIVQLMARTWNISDSWFLCTPQKGWRRHYVAWLKLQLQGAGMPGSR